MNYWYIMWLYLKSSILSKRHKRLYIIINLSIWHSVKGKNYRERNQIMVAWKWKSLSRVWLFATPWTIQIMEFSRPEYPLEWVAFSFSRGSSQPRDQTQVSHIAGGFFYQLSYQGSPYGCQELDIRRGDLTHLWVMSFGIVLTSEVIQIFYIFKKKQK